MELQDVKLWLQKIEDRLQDMEATVKLFKSVMNDVYTKIAALERHAVASST